MEKVQETKWKKEKPKQQGLSVERLE
uniref:Uncharacterized protein n=1 Tax=Rhizophora mucronata TaxID=61149 RepID=A0A2P2PGJ5_RHIMU